MENKIKLWSSISHALEGRMGQKLHIFFVSFPQIIWLREALFHSLHQKKKKIMSKIWKIYSNPRANEQNPSLCPMLSLERRQSQTVTWRIHKAQFEYRLILKYCNLHTYKQTLALKLWKKIIIIRFRFCSFRGLKSMETDFRNTVLGYHTRNKF